MNCPSHRDVARLVSGLLEPETAAALREHLRHCPECGRVHMAMAALTDRLAPDPGEFDAPDFVGGVMDSIRLRRPATAHTAALGKDQPSMAGMVGAASRAWVRPLCWTVPFVAAAATIALMIRHTLPRWQTGPDGFVSRGGGEVSPDRWVSIEVFRASEKGYSRVADQIAIDDALAFTYSNPGDQGYRYLMILALDDNGQVFWYYPAHSGDTQQLRSIEIDRTPRAELPDEIRHRLRSGLLRIFALFSREPHDADEIERIAERDLREAKTVDRLDRLRVAETGQHSILLRSYESADAGVK